MRGECPGDECPGSGCPDTDVIIKRLAERFAPLVLEPDNVATQWDVLKEEM